MSWRGGFVNLSCNRLSNRCFNIQIFPNPTKHLEFQWNDWADHPNLFFLLNLLSLWLFSSGKLFFGQSVDGFLEDHARNEGLHNYKVVPQ